MPKESIDYTWLYGKYMKDNLANWEIDTLKNFSNKNKIIENITPKTILKAKPVDDVLSIAIDEKQQEE